MKVISAIIMLEFWKKRNTKRYGKKISYSRMNNQCRLTMYQLIRVKISLIKEVPSHWSGIIELLQRYKSTLYYYILAEWSLPEEK